MSKTKRNVTHTSATCTPETLKKLHEIKRVRKWSIINVLDVLADRELARIEQERTALATSN